jgi:hypothetical protein
MDITGPIEEGRQAWMGAGFRTMDSVIAPSSRPVPGYPEYRWNYKVLAPRQIVLNSNLKSGLAGLRVAQRVQAG